MTCTVAMRFEGQSGVCVQCGTKLTGRQQRWCGEKCPRAYGRNHWWTDARAAALARSSGYPDAAGSARYSEASCDNCGGREGLEVNHVEPRVGRGYGPGCHHHQTNLQVLCHDCHVAETTRQRRERPIWYALEMGVITAEEAQRHIDRAFWWKRGLPNPESPMDSLWAGPPA